MPIPTTGRRVWFFPNAMTITASGGQIHNHDENVPMDAGIAYVHTPTMINISFADHIGRPHSATSIRLLDGEPRPASGEPFCEWMPYQKEQAVKGTEILTTTTEQTA